MTFEFTWVPHLGVIRKLFVDVAGGSRVFFLTACFNGAVSALETGDIAFVGFNADGDDDLAFVALKEIPAGTEIFLSDNEWNGLPVGSTGAFIDAAESELKWTAPAGGLAAGTVVSIAGIELSAPLTVSVGSVVYTSSFNVGVGSSGEAIFAYTGSTLAPAKFIAAVISGPVSAAGSLNGTGLVTGMNAISVTPGTPDVVVYNGPRVGKTSFAEYLPLLHDPTRWLAQDGSGSQHNDGIPPDVPFDATPFAIMAPPAVPTLTIQQSPPGFVTLSWTPDTPGWSLQESTQLTPTGWSNAPSGATNPVVIAITPGRKFFRLTTP